MKLLIIVLSLASFNLFATGCDEYRLNSLERMDPEFDYCSDDLVQQVAVELYIGTRAVERIEKFTPRRDQVYGDNDGSTLLVVQAVGEKAKYIRYTVKYGKCNIISCSDSGYYRDKI